MTATKPRNRNKNQETVVQAPKPRIELPPTPLNAGDWICNAPPEKHADNLYHGTPCVIGRPRRTVKFTEDELIQKGLVGVYFRKGAP